MNAANYPFTTNFATELGEQGNALPDLMGGHPMLKRQFHTLTSSHIAKPMRWDARNTFRSLGSVNLLQAYMPSDLIIVVDIHVAVPLFIKDG